MITVFCGFLKDKRLFALSARNTFNPQTIINRFLRSIGIKVFKEVVSRKRACISRISIAILHLSDII